MAAHKMFTMIDRVPDIDSENMSGQIPEKVTGTLELRNVRFAYPSRPKQTIFEDFSLVIPTGKSVALVGLRHRAGLRTRSHDGRIGFGIGAIGAIVGIATGVFVAVVLILVCFILCWCRRGDAEVESSHAGKQGKDYSGGNSHWQRPRALDPPRTVLALLFRLHYFYKFAHAITFPQQTTTYSSSYQRRTHAGLPLPLQDTPTSRNAGRTRRHECALPFPFPTHPRLDTPSSNRAERGSTVDAHHVSTPVALVPNL